jgi:hypothetical protein
MINLLFRYKGRPDLQMHGMITAGDMPFYEGFLNYQRPFIDDIGDPSDYTVFSQGLVIAPTLLHPKAEGQVKLRTTERHEGSPGTDKSHPIIEYEMFGDKEDLDRMVEGIRRLERIMEAPAMAAHDPTLLYARSLAAQFGEDTDEYWRQYVSMVYDITFNC